MIACDNGLEPARRKTEGTRLPVLHRVLVLFPRQLQGSFERVGSTRLDVWHDADTLPVLLGDWVDWSAYRHGNREVVSDGHAIDRVRSASSGVTDDRCSLLSLKS